MPVLPCDAAKPEDVAALIKEVDRKWDGLDILVHSIAFAPVEDLRGRFHEISREGVMTAVDVSAYTLVSPSRAAPPPSVKAAAGAVLALTFNAGPSCQATTRWRSRRPPCYLRAYCCDLGPSNSA